MASNSKDGDFEKESHCFFCLGECKKQIGIFDGELSKPVFINTNNLFPLRHFSRFLNQFGENGDDLNASRSDSLKGELYAFAYNSTVHVCGNCSEITKEFSDLYQVLEETKLRLQWCIQKMRDVMMTTTAKDDPTNTESCQIKVDDEAKNLLEPLRLKIIERMRAVTRLMLPQVILRKTNLSSPVPISNNNDNKAVDIEPVNTTVQQEVIQKPCDQLPATADQPQCPFCSTQFQASNSFYGAWMLRQHLLQYHCEHFFPSEKLASVTDAQYKKILADLLFKDLITGNGCCSFCSKKFTGRKGVVNVAGIKSHLVESHHKELKENLILIQKDPNLLETLSQCNPQGMMSECGAYLQIGQEDNCNQKPVKGQCSNTDAPNYKNLQPAAPNLSPPKFKLPSLLQKKKQEVPLMQADSQSNFDPLNPNEKKCNLRSKIVSRTGMFLHATPECIPVQHLPCLPTIQSVPVPAKIPALSKENTSVCKRIPRRRYIINLDLKLVRVQGNKDAENRMHLQCSYCKAEFLPSSSKKAHHYHTIQHHLEHYFAECKLDSITNSQFQKILAEILFKNLLNTNGKEKKACQCHYCSKSFAVPAKRNNDDVTGWHFQRIKFHMIRFHHEDLKEALMKIQRDPNLSEMLEKSKSTGRDCKSCGLFMANVGIRRIHEKMYCKKGTQKNLCESKKPAKVEEPKSAVEGTGVDEGIEDVAMSEDLEINATLEDGEFLFEEEFASGIIKTEMTEYEEDEEEFAMDQDEGANSTTET